MFPYFCWTELVKYCCGLVAAGVVSQPFSALLEGMAITEIAILLCILYIFYACLFSRNIEKHSASIHPLSFIL